MKFLFICNGTRGDIEPCIAVGKILQDKGEEVICLFPESFEKLTLEAGLDYRNFGPGIYESMKQEFHSFKTAEGNHNYNIPVEMIERNQIILQHEVIMELQPDRIIHNFNSIIALFWEIQHPGRTFLMSVFPYLHSTSEHAYFSFNGNYGNIINKITYWFALHGKMDTLNYATKILALPTIPKNKMIKAIKNQNAIYTISPTLFPKPKDWKTNVHIVGFHERDKIMAWKPEESLIKFITENSKILFLTFGSMLSKKAEERTKILLKILVKHNIPAIINTYAGGITTPVKYNQSLFYFTPTIPYEWIFPKVHAVVHHGGSGTTHMAVKYGKPSLIFPHIGDQYIWKKIIAKNGLGPKGVHITKIKEARLEHKILELWNNPSYTENALRFSKLLKEEENLKEQLYQILTE